MAALLEGGEKRRKDKYLQAAKRGMGWISDNYLKGRSKYARILQNNRGTAKQLDVSRFFDYIVLQSSVSVYLAIGDTRSMEMVNFLLSSLKEAEYLQNSWTLAGDKSPLYSSWALTSIAVSMDAVEINKELISRARKTADWLASLQTQEGSWKGQIHKGQSSEEGDITHQVVYALHQADKAGLGNYKRPVQSGVLNILSSLDKRGFLRKKTQVKDVKVDPDTLDSIVPLLIIMSNRAPFKNGEYKKQREALYGLLEECLRKGENPILGWYLVYGLSMARL